MYFGFAFWMVPQVALNVGCVCVCVCVAMNSLKKHYFVEQNNVF